MKLRVKFSKSDTKTTEIINPRRDKRSFEWYKQFKENWTEGTFNINNREKVYLIKWSVLFKKIEENGFETSQEE